MLYKQLNKNYQNTFSKTVQFIDLFAIFFARLEILKQCKHTKKETFIMTYMKSDQIGNSN